MLLLRVSKKRFSGILIFFLILSMTIGNMSIMHNVARAEVGDVMTYSFMDLAVTPKGNPNWTIVKTNPDNMRITKTSYQFINKRATDETDGEYVEINFYVPETGNYDVKFTTWEDIAGGPVDIEIDGVKVKAGLNFYAPAKTTPTVKDITDNIKLTKGIHILKLIAAGSTLYAPHGYYNYATLQDMMLILKESVWELNKVELTADRTVFLVGESIQLVLSGFMGDKAGTPADLSEAELISYESSDTSIITVDKDNGTVTTVNTGTAKVIVSVTLDGVTVNGEMDITVIDHPELVSIALDAVRTQMFTGDVSRLDLTGTLNTLTPADFSTADTVYFESSDTSVIQVEKDNNATGRAIAVGAGTATVTVSVSMGGIDKNASVQFSVQEVTSSKARSTYYTEEKVEAARNNIENYTWAKSIRDAAVGRADTYVNLGAEFIWNLVPPQSIPRSYEVNLAHGCPNCGNDVKSFGQYPWLADPINNPWKIECPSCEIQLPTNDFDSYYKSGLDAHGIFDPDRADKSLLVNTSYTLDNPIIRPEIREKFQNDPDGFRMWGVDDAYGYTDENNNTYTPVAYYAHWKLWYGGVLTDAITSLRDAYVYTGDIRYARVGIALLDRVADVYPSMDISAYNQSIFLNSHGNYYVGKIVGKIWETGLIKDYISAYDAFFPAIGDPEVISFLSGQSDKYDLGVLKKSATGIKRNIEDGIIRQIYPAVRAAKIHGNNGMHQSTLAMAAVVFDTLPETKDWLDFNFQAGGFVSNPVSCTGGNLLATFINDVDRDGMGNEASPEYNSLWPGFYTEIADILNGYDKYPAADLYQNAKFRKLLTAQYPLLLSDRYTPLVGDAGSTGNPMNYLNKAVYIKAYQMYKDPALAQVIHFLNGNNTIGIHGDIFSAEPENVAREIEDVIAQNGPFEPASINLTGYGLSALQDGKNPKRSYGIVSSFFQMTPVDRNRDYKLFEKNGVLQFETPADATAVGSYITFSVSVPKTEEYEIDLVPWRAGSYGKYDVKIDGQSFAIVDFYGSQSKVDVLGKIELTEGNHQITFECIGKNEKASGYKMGLIQIALLNKAAQAQKEAAGTQNTQRDIWMYYGINTGHGHKDTLNLGMHAFELDLLPDLGYPEVATSSSAMRYEWVQNTISHNTVVVDQSKQKDSLSGKPVYFDDGDMVKLIDAEAPNVYTQTELYKRTTAMIKVDEANSYTVDFFRVKGGNDHHFSFHSAEGAVTTEGLDLVAQETGTYAGPGINKPENNYTYSGASSYMGSGFQWLTNVQKDENPGDAFSVDWKIKDTWNIYGRGTGTETDVHLRLTMLGQVDDVALADGTPPQRPGNPTSLKYLIAHRNGTNLDSLFTSVIEPYNGERYIESISPVVLRSNGQVVEGSTAKGVKVVLKNGRIDYILSSIDPDTVYNVDGKFDFKGIFAVYTEKNGKCINAYLNDGEKLGSEIENATSHLSGTVTDFTKDLSTSNRITVRMDTADFDESIMLNRVINIQNDGIRNACYNIRGIISRDIDTVTLDIGDITFIRRWADINDFSKGYIYDIAEGQSFVIPLSVSYINDDIEPEQPPVSEQPLPVAQNPGATSEDVEEVKDALKEYREAGSQDKAGLLNKVVDSIETALENASSIDEKSIEKSESDDSVSYIVSKQTIDDILKKLSETRQDLESAVKDAGLDSIINIERKAIKLIAKETIKKETRIQLPAESVAELKSMNFDILVEANGVTFKIPGAAVPLDDMAGQVELTIHRVEAAELAAGENMTPAGEMLDLELAVSDGKTPRKVESFNKKVTVKLAYNSTGVDENKLGIYRYNPETKAWDYVSGKVNTKDGTVEFTTTHFSTYAVMEYNRTFSDIENHWARYDIEVMTAKHIIKGKNDVNFAPEMYISRAEFAALIVRALGLELTGYGNTFKDVSPGKWYAEIVQTAADNGLIEGDGVNFRPDDPITREEMAVMIIRAYNLGTQNPAAAGSIDKFRDRDRISIWAEDAVKAAYGLGLIVGVDDINFAPKANATRAQTAVIIRRLLDKM